MSVQTAYGQDSPRTLAENLDYRFTFGDLPYAQFMPGAGRSVLVTEGSEALLETCLHNPNQWVVDSFWEKLAHAHPSGTISCRERGASPNIHFRFVIANGKTSIHIDQDGPERKWRHFGEIIRNRTTFGRTHQDDIFLALVKKDPASSSVLVQSLTPTFDTNEKFHDYVHAAFSPESFADTTMKSSFIFAFHTIETGIGPKLSFEKSLEYHAIDGTLRLSIESAAAIGLRQDVRFKPCVSCSSFRSRMSHALLYSVLVDGYDGHRELAFPRIAGAFGSAYIENDLFHPWMRGSPNPMLHVGNSLLADVAESFYVEFARTPLKQFEKKLLNKIGR